MLTILIVWLNGVGKYHAFPGVLSLAGNEKYVIPTVNYYHEALPEILFLLVGCVVTAVAAVLYVHKELKASTDGVVGETHPHATTRKVDSPLVFTKSVLYPNPEIRAGDNVEVIE